MQQHLVGNGHIWDRPSHESRSNESSSCRDTFQTVTQWGSNVAAVVVSDQASFPVNHFLGNSPEVLLRTDGLTRAVGLDFVVWLRFLSLTLVFGFPEMVIGRLAVADDNGPNG